jgi:hypothetical protein
LLGDVGHRQVVSQLAKLVYDIKGW